MKKPPLKTPFHGAVLRVVTERDKLAMSIPVKVRLEGLRYSSHLVVFLPWGASYRPDSDFSDLTGSDGLPFHGRCLEREMEALTEAREKKEERAKRPRSSRKPRRR